MPQYQQGEDAREDVGHLFFVHPDIGMSIHSFLNGQRGHGFDQGASLGSVYHISYRLTCCDRRF